VKPAPAAVALLLLLCALPARADVPACLHDAEEAQPLRGQGRLLEARARLIACTADGCPSLVRADCARWLAEVEAALPSLVPKARDARGVDLVDVRVSVDGALAKERLDGRGVPVDPGAHVVRIEAPGRRAVEQEVVVGEGEKNRIVAVTLLAPEDEAPTASASAPPAERPDADATSGGTPAIAWVLGAAGLAGVGAGATFWGVGLSERSDLATRCASPSSCVQSDVDAAKTKLVVGDVLVGVGALALAAGVYLGLRAAGRPRTTIALDRFGVGCAF
jgi:hypothetical protein